MYRARFALLYTALIVSAAGFSVVMYLRPYTKTAAPKQTCPGIHGAEKCIRDQINAQGAPDGSLTCAEAQMPGNKAILCVFNAGAGGGCYDLVAHRGHGGYPLLEATAQTPTC